jgi:hypothetical protein
LMHPPPTTRLDTPPQNSSDGWLSARTAKRKGSLSSSW